MFKMRVALFKIKTGRYLFGGVLLLGYYTAELVVQRLSVLQVLHLVDPHEPVLRSERLLQVLELNVLVANLSVACPVEARRRSEVQLGERRGCYSTVVTSQSFS